MGRGGADSQVQATASSNCRLERLRHEASGLIPAAQHQHRAHPPQASAGTTKVKKTPRKTAGNSAFTVTWGLWKGHRYGQTLSSLETKQGVRVSPMRTTKSKGVPALEAAYLPTWAKPHGYCFVFQSAVITAHFPHLHNMVFYFHTFRQR